MSVQHICINQTDGIIGGGNSCNGNISGTNSSNNALVPHSQSAHEIGQVPLTPLAQHQQALHHQLQLRFANANNNSSGKPKTKLL